MTRLVSHSITRRLIVLFVMLLAAFTVLVLFLYNALLRRQTIAHYGDVMRQDAYAISQSLSEIIAPSGYESLDETRFMASEENLAAYLAMTEQLTRCNVYLIDLRHSVTGYFDGLVQDLEGQLLPGYLEQAVALGFMGKSPFVQSQMHGETHLAACMPVMNVSSRVLGVVLLDASLSELGYSQAPTLPGLLISLGAAFVLSTLLAMFFSRMFTKPIAHVEKVATTLAGGDYQTRTEIVRKDEIGSLARTMDILAERLEDARQRDEQLHAQQQAFFADISHELKTPVTVIRASLEALRDEVVSDPGDVRAYYAQMIQESQSLQRLILDLLELSRLQNLAFTLDMVQVSLTELLGDVAMSAHSLCARKGLRFTCCRLERDFVVRGDYSRLRQMLVAVIDNAVKFTAPGRTVSMAPVGDGPVLRIADEGVGIAPEELCHIFDRYHRSSKQGQSGTGLGLPIVQEIAKRHRIRLEVASEPGQGTAFCFDFTEALL